MILGLTICGANCLLSADYKSASKIIARTGQAEPGKGDVIVTTRSGGEGSCTVQFKSVMVVPGRIQYKTWLVQLLSTVIFKATVAQCSPVSSTEYFIYLTIFYVSL